MNFNFFKKPEIISEKRKEYVKECTVEKVNLIPCDKYVACYQRLNKNLSLSLSDPEEKIKTANISVLEFNEGYELQSENTDKMREKVVLLSKKAYFLTNSLIVSLSNFEQVSKNKEDVNEIKMEVRVLSEVMLNIYQHLSSSDDVPESNNSFNGDIMALINQLINTLIELLDRLNIDYMNKQINVSLLKLMNYRYVLGLLR